MAIWDLPDHLVKENSDRMRKIIHIVLWVSWYVDEKIAFCQFFVALLDLDYPKGSNGFSVSESGETLEIVVPDDAKFNDEWLESKFNFVTDVRKYVSTNELKLVEVYPKPEGSEASAETGKTE